MAAVLRRRRFDAAILFQNAFDAALVTWLAGVPIRAGYRRHARGPLLTHAVDAPRKGELGHESLHYLELLRCLRLIPALPSVGRIELPHGQHLRSHARAELLLRIAELPSGGETTRADVRVVGINPGASFGTAKRWLPERFSDLMVRVYREAGALCVLFGAPAEQELASQILHRAGVPAVSLAGKTTLQQFMELVAGCDLFITNDSGTMHIAAALGVPTLAIFGPTNEHETAPLGRSVEIVTGEAFCRPCKLRHCPIDHRCMTTVPVDQVFEAAKRLLQGDTAVPLARCADTASVRHGAAR